MKYLIVVDMQNDFVTGSLANKDAEAIVPKIAKFIAESDIENVIFTRDTHEENYLDTQEGKSLPVKHCINGTTGWNVVDELVNIAEKSNKKITYINKEHFGFNCWDDILQNGDEVYMCGTCTDICVASNALTIKMIEGVTVNILADCCAGVTPQKHNSAIDVMQSCQCNII